MNSIEINLLCGDGGTGGDFSDISLMMKIESYFTLVEFAVGGDRSNDQTEICDCVHQHSQF